MFLPAQLAQAKKILAITSDSIFEEWHWEEKTYLLSLQKEPPADLLSMQYLEMLKKLCVAEYVFCQTMTYAYTDMALTLQG